MRLWRNRAELISVIDINLGPDLSTPVQILDAERRYDGDEHGQ